MTLERRPSLWIRGAGIALIGSLLFYGGFWLLWGYGPPGRVLTGLWAVPVSSVLAGMSYFACRKLFFSWRRMFLICWTAAATASISAAHATNAGGSFSKSHPSSSEEM